MIQEVISNYHFQTTEDKHHRFKSWEHCSSFFFEHYEELEDEKIFDQACLQLAFYLASWGMLRGSSFLLFKDYKVHEYFIRDVIMNPQYKKYFIRSSGRQLEDDFYQDIETLIADTRNAYIRNIDGVNTKRAKINITDTLASKILLGVFGCVPAFDRYFIKGLALFGIKVQFGQPSLEQLLHFYNVYLDQFEECRKKFENDGTGYTPMKLIDMFFWQVGYMLDHSHKSEKEFMNVMSLAEEYKTLSKLRVQQRYPKTTVSYKKRKVFNPGLTDKIREYISTTLESALQEGYEFHDLKSGDIHKRMGLKDRLPAVCNAMESLDHYDNYKILHDTPSRKSSTKLIRYYF